ncbi:unnamed protein product [Linum trigynum]|uniref:Secreted protein n=1 Tax=Linum trigynum TaxID=586398 RepID=A0AAV2CWH1_9ROSI
MYTRSRKKKGRRSMVMIMVILSPNLYSREEGSHRTPGRIGVQLSPRLPPQAQPEAEPLAPLARSKMASEESAWYLFPVRRSPLWIGF